jgi:crotonobetainyl-CoA:carnitine CoA-transferase CaiB-like acyl-CoA transferase
VIGDGPLSGIRVLDYCWVGAGAFVTKLLADHGADVIKIESRSHPDNLRLAPPYREGAEGLEGSGYFASRNSSKRSFTLDMTHPEAPAIARRLAAASSIVTSNFRPGIMERWGLSYEEIRETNPQVIYLSMPMQGNDGPHRTYVGFGSTIAALSGLVWLSGRPDRTPVGTGTHYPDHVPNPGHALVALLGAIYRREMTGEGQAIELSQFESTVNILGPAVVAFGATGRPPIRDGNRSPMASPNGVFRVAGDDRWCAISARDDREWAALAGVLGHPEWATEERFATLAARKANEDELERLVDAETRLCQPEHLVDALVARGVPAATVTTSADLLDDPQLAARGFWHRLDHPYMGSIVVNRAPFSSNVDASGPRSPAPLLGEHTREIAEGVLGMSPAEVDDLVARKVFF